MKELKTYYLNEETFDNVLQFYYQYVINVDNFENYIFGGNFKNSIIYDGIKKIIITEHKLMYLLGQKSTNNWTQCICYRKAYQEEKCIKGYNGGTCFKIFTNKLLKYYTIEEIDKCLKQFESEYNSENAQLHFNYTKESNIIYKYTNCRKYDINGAYANALINIFPKAREMILHLYAERKIHPENKAIINYYVGMLCNKGYRKTFNWIVQKTRLKLEEAINYVDGILLYANTDGFIVSYETKSLPTSKNLGEFKLEYEGDIYILAGNNYWIYQQSDLSITGNVLYHVRDMIDLTKGLAVCYDRIKQGNTYIAKNIKKIKLEILNG